MTKNSLSETVIPFCINISVRASFVCVWWWWWKEGKFQNRNSNFLKTAWFVNDIVNMYNLHGFTYANVHNLHRFISRSKRDV